MMENREKLEIMLTVDQIKITSQNQFISLVSRLVEEEALEYINKEKDRKNKILHIPFKELKSRSH